ncbi:MAG TPA: cyclic nucleotide-binding domain-containing protein [Anaerolineales bacterium]|nr:cyclic nucleotide-binding domain-containing protein [Anaerolineales bacterium]HNO93641.1 cyclic nucleotide-binding domain-containing protein [Anaerolineales bacterium]
MTPNSASPLIEIKNLVKTYKTPAGDFTAVKGIDVEVQRGEFVAVIGKSGSGKSTFINMITGIDRPTSGEIYIDGAPVHSFSEAQMAAWRGRNLGIVFQFFQLFPTLTLLENVILPMELNHLYTKKERRERAMDLLKLVEMDHQAHKLPTTISGGQQQRVAIARSLANDPPLLIADEPTGNLDSKTAAKIFSLFEELVASGKTILMVTHDSDLARRVNRTILISDGEVVNEYLVRALATLTQDQLVEVARRVKPQIFPPDASITRQGEVGDKFYILLDGKADVYLNEAGGGQVLVNELKRGQYFGEMALLGSGVRTATVKASPETSVSVAALDSMAFNKLVKESRTLQDELKSIIERRNILDQLKVFASAMVKDPASKSPIEFGANQEIIKQGDGGEVFYLILEGKVNVIVDDSQGEETIIEHLGKGAIFGESILLGDTRYRTTVRVSKEKPAKVLAITPEEFNQFAEQNKQAEAKKKPTESSIRRKVRK